MAVKPHNPPATGALAPEMPERLLELTIAANQIAAGSREANPYQVRNQLLTQKAKAHVRYRNGVTLPTSAEVLLANAERRDYNHRRTLSRNLVQVTAQPRPAEVCAHHIVALHDPAADPSRDILFDCGIGINDVDNGVFLPSGFNKLPDYPNAPRHDPYHRLEYHLAVYDGLRIVASGDARTCRITLKSLKAKILSGALPL